MQPCKRRPRRSPCRDADFSDRFPRIAEAVHACAPCPADNAMIDGGAIVFRPGGHSDFAALRTTAGGQKASFVAFDLLHLEGARFATVANFDLRDRPLEKRRERLEQLVAGVDSIQLSSALETEGATVFEHAGALGLDGIVSKRAGSRYRSGPSRNWLKCLNPIFART
jgi:bifunctional non-homologous end joining protein LigD